MACLVPYEYRLILLGQFFCLFFCFLRDDDLSSVFILSLDSFLQNHKPGFQPRVHPTGFYESPSQDRHRTRESDLKEMLRSPARSV